MDGVLETAAGDKGPDVCLLYKPAVVGVREKIPVENGTIFDNRTIGKMISSCFLSPP